MTHDGSHITPAEALPELLPLEVPEDLPPEDPLELEPEPELPDPLEPLEDPPELPEEPLEEPPELPEEPLDEPPLEEPPELLPPLSESLVCCDNHWSARGPKWISSAGVHLTLLSWQAG